MLQEKVFDITCYDGLEGAPDGCRGNSMIVRVGDRVFATFNHQERNRMPYNRTCLEIYEKKGDSVWKLAFRDEGVYQMDPSPIMYLGDNRLAVTANLTVARYAADEVCKMVPCTPVVYIFDITEELKRVEVITLPYDAPAYQFVDHCYRSCTRDIENGNMLFTNQIADYSHKYADNIHSYGKKGVYDGFCYSLLDKNFLIKRMGRLTFPERACHHCMTMKDGETYIFGIQDVIEYNKEWKQFKYELTGDKWDYTFRKIYLLYSPDITTGEFTSCEVVCDREDTCGFVNNLDCCYDANGDVLLLVYALDIWHLPMKERFFPDAEPMASLEFYRFSKGVLKEKRVIDQYPCQKDHHPHYTGFFHTAANGEIYVLWDRGIGAMKGHCIYFDSTELFLSRINALEKEPVRLGEASGRVLFGSKIRLGAVPDNRIDMYYDEEGKSMRYARYDLEENV